MKIVRYLVIPLVSISLGLSLWNSDIINEVKAEQINMNNTEATLAAYRKAVERAPDNTDNWDGLGRLFFRRGELAQAEEAFRRMLFLGEARQDKATQAAAYGNLAFVHQSRSDLKHAEQMLRKALLLNKALGRKEGMAINYSSLGLVYQTRGNLDETEALWKKALTLLQEIQHSKAEMIQQWLTELARRKADMAETTQIDPDDVQTDV